MPTIHFKNVGRSKRSWSEEMPFAHLDQIVRAVRKQRVLMSRDIAATYDENADLMEHCEGTIFAGLHSVGRFEVVKEAKREG